MSENMTIVSGNGHDIRNSFDYFDEFLKNRNVNVEDNMEDASDLIVEDDGESASSSSYYEEEIIDDNIGLANLRLDTVHETEDCDSNDEEASETEVFWEEVSESFHCESDNADDGDITEELETNSDMIARVRNILRGDNNDQGENSLVDNSSRCSSSSDEGSSSVLPFDFDLGSYEEGRLHTSDEEEEDPKDYEQECRKMIATVHPNLDPKKMLHGCDLQNLYTNLKPQYRYLLRDTPAVSQAYNNIPQLSEEERLISEDDDVNDFVELSFRSHSDSHGDMVSPESTVDDFKLEDANEMPAIEHSPNVFKIDNHCSQQVATTPTPKVEKWLERSADDPEDYEHACRCLCQSMFDKNDLDHDVNTMLRRSTPVDLYRYLKHHYWHLGYTNQLDENGVYRSNSNESIEGDEEIKAEESTTMKTNIPDLHMALPSKNVESLRSLFLEKSKIPEQRKNREGEINSDSTTKNIGIHEEMAYVHCDQPENECLNIEESPLPSQKTAYDQNESSDSFDDTEEPAQENIVQNSLNDSTISSSTEKKISVHSVREDINLTKDSCGDQPSDNLEETEEPAQEIIVLDSLNDSTISSSTEKESSVRSVREDIDMDEPFVDQPNENLDDNAEPVHESIVQNSLNDSTISSFIENKISVHSVREDINLTKESCGDQPSDNLDDIEGPTQESLIQNSLNDSTISSSKERESSVHSVREDIDLNESCSDQPSDNLDDNEEPVQENIVQNNLNDSTISSSTEKESSVHSVREDMYMTNEPCGDQPSDTFHDNDEPVQEIIVQNILNDVTISASTEKESLVHDEREGIDLNESCSDQPSDNFDNTNNSAQEIIVQDILNDSTFSSSTEKESSVHNERDDIDMNEPCGEKPSENVDYIGEPAKENVVQHSLNDSTMSSSTEKESSVHSVIEDIDLMNESCGDQPSDYLDDNAEPSQENIVQNSLNKSTISSSAEKEIPVHSGREDIDMMNEPCDDQASDTFHDTKDLAQEIIVQDSLNDSTLSSSTEKESSVHIGSDDFDLNDPFADQPSDNFDDTEEPAQESIVQDSPNDSTLNLFTEKESSVHIWREEIGVDEPLGDVCSDAEKRFGQENQFAGENEGRTENILSNSSATGTTHIHSPEGGKLFTVGDVANLTDKSNEIAKADQSNPFVDTTSLKHFREDGNGVEHKLTLGNDSLSEINNSSVSSKLLQDERSELEMAHHEGQRPDPKELEWRKLKIEGDLRSIIEETEEVELCQSISSEIIAALKAGSLRTAYTKKYYHPKRHDYIYYPSVAKVVQNFSLIEEAEKIFHNEFSFELSTALCTVAASRMNADDTKLDENNIAIREATVNVVLEEIMKESVDDVLNESTTSFRRETGLESPAEVLSENKVRKERIKDALECIIKDVEENDVGDTIEDEAINALIRAANEIVFVKKFFDLKTDMFKYFPSVKQTILNYSLMERAQCFYFDGVQSFPPDYISALRASASRLREDFDVDELDDSVIKTAVDVEVDDAHEENQSDKCCEFLMRNNTTSMMPSQINRASHVNEGSDDANALEDLKNIQISKALQDVNKQKDDQQIAEALLDDKASLLMERFLDERRNIDQALVDLESELVSELNRLDNESNECSLNHKTEMERIEKDRRGVEEKSLADESKISEQTKALREKLSTAFAILELEQINANKVIEKAEIEMDECKNWGWFKNKSKNSFLDKEKQKQERLMKFKLREIELMKDADDIKAELGFVQEQAKAKKYNISEWQAELDEEYRHLKDLTSATEEKLNEEMRHLHSSYEEERQRLLKEINKIEETRRKDDKWVAFEKRKLYDKYASTGGGIPRPQIERNEIGNDEEGHLNENDVALKEKRAKEEKALLLERESSEGKRGDHDIINNLEISSVPTTGEMVSHPSNAQGILERERSQYKDKNAEEDIFVDESAVAKTNCFDKDVSVKLNTQYIEKKGMTGEDSSSESNKLSVLENSTHCDGKDSGADSYTKNIFRDELMNENSSNACYEGDDSIQSNTTGTAEDRLTGENSVEKNSNSILINITGIGGDDRFFESGDSVVPDHLALLNQPKELQDEGSLGSLDIFDSPEINGVSSEMVLKGKTKEDKEIRSTEEETRAIPDHISSLDQQKQLQGELLHRSPGGLDLSKDNELSSKKFLAAALKGNKKELVDTLPAGVKTETILASEEKIDCIARKPRRSLSEMRRKVEETLERAMTIRNGDSSSRHSRSIAHEPQIDRSVENGSSGDRNISNQDNLSLTLVPSEQNSTNEIGGEDLKRYRKGESNSKGNDRSLPDSSPPPSRQPLHPICTMIRETDRLSGFIRRYEKKLEKVCRSLLTLASVSGEEKEILAARQLDLPEMLEFVVSQDWYQANSTDMKSTGAPQLIFSKVKKENEVDSVGDNRYTITSTGKLFLQIDGPVPSDVCRFLTYLSSIEEGLTRDSITAQWKEIAVLSGDEQSQRLYDKLDKLISFCIDSHMIKK